jgi:hypothetical protein
MVTAAPVSPIPVPVMELNEMLRPLAKLKPPLDDTAQAAPRQPRRRAIDVGAVITRALTAAGLMKQG